MTLKNLSKSTITKIVNKKVNYIADVDTETRYFVDSIIEYFQVVKVSQNKNYQNGSSSENVIQAS